MKKIFLLMTLALMTSAIALTMTACGGGDDSSTSQQPSNPSDDNPTPSGTLQLTQTCATCNGEIILHSFSFSEAGGNEIINIRCTSEWSAYADVDWISFSQSAGKGIGWITVTAAKNPIFSHAKNRS